jgi:uncharacterized protein (TIGR00725 family)
MRQLIVGLVGGDQQKDSAEELGRVLTGRGWILLTGGQIVKGSDEVKDASMMVGADAATGKDARLVGILPSERVNWRQPSRRHLFLETGLLHNVRNVINGRTPDIVVAFGGGRGTLAEIAFATAAGNKVIFYMGLGRLNENFSKYFETVSANDKQTYFEDPLIEYPEASGNVGTALGLIGLLRKTLADGKETNCTADVLADRIEATARPKGQTGFPGLPLRMAATVNPKGQASSEGLPRDLDSKNMFEKIINEISK